MKNIVAAIALCLLASCASAPAPVKGPVRTPSTAPAPSSPNSFTNVPTVARTIVEPRIRVGLLSDQTSVTFPRVEGGYYLVTETSSATLKRGFTLTPPLRDTSAHYGVQVASISDLPSATAMGDKIRSETNLRVDLVFDAAAGSNRIIAGDVATTSEAGPIREQLTSRGYGKDMLIGAAADRSAVRKEASADR
jgi:Sporulation related domain.